MPYKISRTQQYLISLVLISIVTGLGLLTQHLLGYRAVALMLLVTVSFLAMVFDIRPVLLAAVLSSLIWDFFFIPPRFTFTVGSGEDFLLLIMYLLIALINAVFTFKIRKVEKLALEKKEKENTIKLYNTILNSLSHELRTPISTIIGAADILKENNQNISSNHKEILVSEISQAAIRLNQQVENLLNMSRLESGEMQPKFNWVDLNELIYKVVNKCKEESSSHHIHVHLAEDLPMVMLDGGFMEQVIYNLVHNAILYTPQGSTIVIKTSIEFEHIKLVVSDNGHGFPPAEIHKVFDKFYRLYNTQPGGTGLGLSIVKGFVEAHKGTIQLKNGKDGGAVFTILIPAKISYINNLHHE